MKVSELIAFLQLCPQSAEVISEGCDCVGDVEGVHVRSDSKQVLFTRRIEQNEVVNGYDDRFAQIFGLPATENTWDDEG